MELDTKRKLIIGALDPRHTTRSRRSARARPDGSTSQPGLQERLLRHLVREPERHAADRRLRRACRRATRRAASRTASTSGPAARRGARPGLAGHDHQPGCRRRPRFEPPDRRRPADLGHRPQRTRRARGVGPAGRHLAQRRLHATTRTTSTRTSAGSRGSPAAAASAATPPTAGTVTRTRTGCARRRRSTRSSWPAAASSGTSRPRATATTASRRRPTSCTTPAGRPTARSGRRA